MPSLPSRDDARPLYAQVAAILRERIRVGAWTPGQALPNEFEIAHELGVSQGTVRKALDQLAAGHLLVRRQGSGTYVADQSPDQWLFRFFNIYRDDGTRALPGSDDARVATGKAKADEQAKLGLGPGDRVVRITRTRLVDGRPLALERIVVPERLFPGLDRMQPLPNTLYDVYQRVFGIIVHGGEERLKPVKAGAREVDVLGVPQGAPLLAVDRLVRGIDGKPVEWRVSLCGMAGAHYLVRLG